MKLELLKFKIITRRSLYKWILERSELVGKTTAGAEDLIWLSYFVVVLALWIVVASVIPLCLLFAISLMNILELMLT
jgi:cobalt-zinc-cadmium resistance protein CzcA